MSQCRSMRRLFSGQLPSAVRLFQFLLVWPLLCVRYRFRFGCSCGSLLAHHLLTPRTAHTHLTHPPTHTHIRNAGEGGRAGQASAWILRRPAQSAAEGARPRHSREQRGGVRHGGQGMWQWQHAGNNAGKMGAVGLLRGGLQPQSRSREMCSYLACCTRDVLSMSPSFLACSPSSHS